MRPLLRTGFLDDFDAATVSCPFSTKRGYMRMFPDVPVSIGLTHEDGDTYVTLEMFEAHPGVRATGAGTEAMRRLLDLTDKHGLSVYLDPHPLDEGWSWDRLVRWYASFGFDFEEDAEDRERSGNYWMQRLPHAKGARRPNPRRRNSAYEPLRWEEGDEDDLDFEAVGHLTDATSAVLHGLELSGQGAASSEAVARAWTGQGVPSTARMLYLHDVTVAPHLRGRGAGRRYVAGIERDARASGAQGVVLHALHSLGFWQKQGYSLWPFPPAERPEQSAVMFKVFGHRQNPRGDTALRTDPELWEEVKASVLAGSKGGRPGQWSARKAQLAVAIYKQEGGGYVGPKSPANSLARWTRQKWRTKSGRPSLETGERYLPAAAIAALTPAEYAATTRAKRAGMKQGQQFVPQPEKVARKVRPYRRRNPEDRGHVRDLVERLHDFTNNLMEAAGEDPSETEFDPMAYPIDDDTLESYLDAKVLGWGATRVVVRLPSGNVAKLPWSDMTQASTDNEWDRWQAASDEVREMLLPPLEYVGGGIGVIVFPFVKTADAAGLDYDHPWLAEAREKWKALWLAGAPGAEAEDYQNTQNWGVYTDPDTGTKRVVLIDYGD